MRNFENRAKIAKVSGILKTLCAVVMVCWMIAAVGTLIAHVAGYFTPHAEPGPVARFWMWYGLPAFAIEFWVYRNFYGFFNRLQDGHLFDGPTVEWLMTAGKWKLAGWLYSCVPLFLTNTFGAGKWQGVGEAGSLTGALAIIFMAWLLREGQTLQEEQELTV